MNDIVIPYLRNNSGELDTCIELIQKNVPYRRIHVVEEFEYSSYSRVSHINQILKLKWAIENLDITDNFYLFNDDFFVMKPINKIPYFYRGTLSEQITARANGSYTNALKTTRGYLQGDELSYELHVPMLFNKQKLYELIVSLEKEIKFGRCPLVRSAYGNLHATNASQLDDVKNVENYEYKTFLSTTEKSFRGEIGKYIRSQV
jgi:hypothetical protein